MVLDVEVGALELRLVMDALGSAQTWADPGALVSFTPVVCPMLERG